MTCWRVAGFILTILVAVPLSALAADVHLTVGKSGNVQYSTVQAAVDAVPANNTTRYVIDISPGTYTEQLRVNKAFVTLRGSGAANATTITFNQTPQSGDILVGASTAIQSKDFIAQNVTFENSAGNVGVALAMNIREDRAIFDNCRFLGWQDTLRSEKGRHYFQNCYIEGSVDFIYGKGQAYFENCTTFSKAPGYVTAQGREGAAETNGFVLHNTTVTGSFTNSNDQVYLGRPWQLYSRSIFIDSNLGDLVSPAGWSIWQGNNNHLTAYFAEYGSTGPGAVGTRPNWSYSLTSQEAQGYSMSAWLSGSDNWNPLAALPEPVSTAIVLPVCVMLVRRSRRNANV